MKILVALFSLLSLLVLPGISRAEEQVFLNGRLVEIRQHLGNTVYAYDAYRNPIYVATSIPGIEGSLEYRDKHGISVGVGGPGNLPWSVRGTWGARD